MEKQHARDKERNALMKSDMGMIQKSCSSDTRIMMGEMAKIQKALNVDFAQMMDEIHGECRIAHEDHMHTDEAAKEAAAGAEHGKDSHKPIKVMKRVREYWCQTDPPTHTEEWTQTDASLLDEKKKKKKGAKKDSADSKGDPKKTLRKSETGKKN